MMRQVFRQLPKCGVQPKPNRNPRSIGGKPQDVKMGIGREFRRNFLQRTTFADLFQYVENFGAFLFVIRRRKHLREEAFGSLRRGVIVD
ncbi:hypothetical protein M717_10335 [Neisseria gonorrhoeae SK33414]|nr:hypothetical protein M717_10335 [Neisseria gonorrhoeae SK33414]